MQQVHTGRTFSAAAAHGSAAILTFGWFKTPKVAKFHSNVILYHKHCLQQADSCQASFKGALALWMVVKLIQLIHGVDMWKWWA